MQPNSDIEANHEEDYRKIRNELIKQQNQLVAVHTKSINSVNCWAKTIIIILLSLFILPFGITSTYYAFTDNSCLNLPAGKLIVTLKDYLAVDGILSLIYYVVILLTIVKTNINTFNSDNIIIKIILILCRIFVLSWTILGAIVFWSLIDNNKCDHGIYNYTFALLIIKFVSIILSSSEINSKNK